MKVSEKHQETIMMDLGGVFLNRGIWIFWSYLSDNHNITFEEAKNTFLKYYKQYFSGIMTEEDFWGNFLRDTKAGNTLFVDDLDTNLNSAKELGIDTILFEDRKQLEIELEKRGI